MRFSGTSATHAQLPGKQLFSDFPVEHGIKRGPSGVFYSTNHEFPVSCEPFSALRRLTIPDDSQPSDAAQRAAQAQDKSDVIAKVEYQRTTDMHRVFRL